jgi:hypothetical protein
MNSGASLKTDTLRLEFEWREDRYGHQIFGTARDGDHGLLISEEGNSDEAWPASPALQSLHLEKRPDGTQMLMLVGMAGRSHWSMSVEADVARNRLSFDVACRLHERPDWLGSTYQRMTEAEKVWLAKGLTMTAWYGNDRWEKTGTAITCSSGRMQMAAGPMGEIYPQTVRWRYAIETKE